MSSLNSECYKNLRKKRKRKLALSANNRVNVNAQYLYSRATFIYLNVSFYYVHSNYINCLPPISPDKWSSTISQI